MCRFWQFGELVEILIDDFLPTRNNCLVYAKCQNENEFWISFLEKAYSK
jgi:Calpain family cysteine protease